MKTMLIACMIMLFGCIPMPNWYETNIDETKAEQIACGLFELTQDKPDMWTYNSDYYTRIDGEVIYIDDQSIRIYVDVTENRSTAIFISNECQRKIYDLLEKTYSEHHHKAKNDAIDKYIEKVTREK